MLQRILEPESQDVASTAVPPLLKANDAASCTFLPDTVIEADPVDAMFLIITALIFA